MRRDLGEVYWQRLSGRSVPLTLTSCFPCVMAESPDGGFEVSFLFYEDNESFVGTVHTQQTRAEIKAIVRRSPNGVVVAGTLSQATVVGNSGERYRMIVGRLEDWI